MRKILEEKLRRFEELEKLLVDPAVLADSAKLSAVYREHGALNKLASKYRRFKQLNDQIREAREMAEGDDPELRQLAESELPGLKAEREKVWDDLLELTIGGRRGPPPLRDGNPCRHRRRGGGAVRARSV